MGHRQRLREKFSRVDLGGRRIIKDKELLLTFAIPRRDVKPLAKTMLKRFGGLGGALEASPKDLSHVAGVGEKSAALVSLARGLAGALVAERAVPLPALNAPEDVARFVGPRIERGGGEFLYALYLNSKNRPIGLDTIFEGRPDVLNLPRRLLMQRAIERNARSIIFVHSVPTLSAAEGAPARPIAMALRALASSVDILVHDYIVLAGGEVMSACEKGWFKA